MAADKELSRSRLLTEAANFLYMAWGYVPEETRAKCKELEEALRDAPVSETREHTIEVPRNVAEHLYGTTIEAGGRCHVCKEYRAIVDAKWPQNHPALNGVPPEEDPPSLR